MQHIEKCRRGFTEFADGYGMSTEAGPGDTTLTPNEAFAVLGNETRMEILRTLGDADESLPFSELRDRVETKDSGQFNYHLDKLAGHFVGQTEEGYTLRQAGRRVIQAVLSGAVTDAPTLERTEIDWPCHYCGAPTIEVDNREEQVGMYCNECEGTYRGSGTTTDAGRPADQDRLGYLQLPPAGVHGRMPEELLSSAFIWTYGEFSTASRGVCPRCSAPVEDSLLLCDTHDASDGLCEECGRRYGVAFRTQCTNCIFNYSAVFGVRLLANPDLQSFHLDHGLDHGNPSSERLRQLLAVYDEEVIDTDPFEARFTFTIDDDALTLTVDEEFTVVDVYRQDSSEAA